MRVKDVIEKIDFHDSNIIELRHENNMVRLKIDLCMWKQEGYREGEDELKEISLVFVPVDNCMLTRYLANRDKAGQQGITWEKP